MPDREIHKIGLIGWPIKHSLSPKLHQAAIAFQQIPWQYDLYPIDPANFDHEIHKLLASDLRGFNVTAPYKESIIPFLDECDESSKKLQAVNTVCKMEDGCWMGSNTDVIGLRKALMGFGLLGKVQQKVTVLGNGGVARAVLAVLLEFPIHTIEILARNQKKTIQLIDLFSDQIRSGTQIRSGAITEELVAKSIGSADLVINATPVGMDHCDQKSVFEEGTQLPNHLKFVDLIYHPAETRMMQQVRFAGGMAWNGLDMLIYQAAASFTLWTGLDAPVEEMKEAVLQRMLI